MKYDSIIIGAGPAGVAAAIYLKRANLNILVIETKRTGGQVLNSGLVENYPGFPTITGEDLSNNFEKHLKSLNITKNVEEVLSVEKSKKEFVVKTKQNTYNAATVVVATGAKPRLLNLEHEKELVGMGISYCAYCDGALCKNQDVAVIGGGISASEASLYLSNIAKTVYIINQNKELNAEAITYDLIKKKSNIKIINSAKISSFTKDEEQFLSGITYLKNKKEEKIDLFSAFVYIGRTPDTAFLKGLKVLDDFGYVKADHTTKTNIQGLFAAGDCRVKKVRQIVTAISDGAVASVEVGNCLKENK